MLWWCLVPSLEDGQVTQYRELVTFCNVVGDSSLYAVEHYVKTHPRQDSFIPNKKVYDTYGSKQTVLVYFIKLLFQLKPNYFPG